jgi:carboxylate-amine ligase
VSASSARRLGVEEELLLVDDDGAPVAAAPALLARCASSSSDGRGGKAGDGPQLTAEFYQSQVEIVTSPAREVASLARQLERGRSAVGEAARTLGCAPVAVPGSVVLADAGPTTPGERFDLIGTHYAHVAASSLICALQVHVEIESRQEGVAVLDRVRPWLPTLLALSANSPFWQGTDTGFASWRSQVWRLWPSAGPLEVLGDVTAYDALVARMVSSGSALDVALLNLDVRLSARHPTVEFRVADVCTDLRDAMVVAALARALTETAAREASAGVGPADWRVDQLRVAAWRAARFGLTAELSHPVTGETAQAGDVIDALLAHAGDALADADDLEAVQDGLRRMLHEGGGATRQRQVHAESGDLASVVDDLRRRTLPDPGTKDLHPVAYGAEAGLSRRSGA